MFSTPLAMTTGRSNPFANAYLQVGAETAITDANPHHLVTMLFDGCLDAVAQARGAMRSGQIEIKGRAIGRAARIVEEGLRGALDLRDGGNLAADLDGLYSYITTRLTLANLRDDEAALEECQRLIAPLRDAWHGIGSQVTGAQR